MVKPLPTARQVCIKAILNCPTTAYRSQRMRAEISQTAEEIKQSIELLRRHL
jgi:predicted TIM-barrel enzyme